MHVVRIPAPRLQRQQQALPFFKLVKALVVLRAWVLYWVYTSLSAEMHHQYSILVLIDSSQSINIDRQVFFINPILLTEI